MDNMIPDSTPDVKTGILYGENYTLLSESAAKAKISLRPDIADAWIKMTKFKEGEYEDYVLQDYIEVFDDPQFKIIKDFLNLYFMPISGLDLYDFFEVMINRKPLGIDISMELLHADLVSKLSLWPKDRANDKDTLKLSQAARILMIPEQKLRTMASQGIINSEKSQGEKGHYRFTREMLREYLKSTS